MIGKRGKIMGLHQRIRIQADQRGILKAIAGKNSRGMVKTQFSRQSNARFGRQLATG